MIMIYNIKNNHQILFLKYCNIRIILIQTTYHRMIPSTIIQVSKSNSSLFFLLLINNEASQIINHQQTIQV
jgi:hypothetical protein